MSEFNLSSPAFKPNQPIPKKYSCNGESINPPLNIHNPPAETKSFTLIIEDPDAPSGTFTHWVLFNIPPKHLSIDENTAPGAEGQNTKGSIGYTAPCPPSGTHRYIFKLFALNITLPLKVGVTKTEVENSQKKPCISPNKFSRFVQPRIKLVGIFNNECGA